MPLVVWADDVEGPVSEGIAEGVDAGVRSFVEVNRFGRSVDGVGSFENGSVVVAGCSAVSCAGVADEGCALKAENEEPDLKALPAL